jgi:alcohol dehydrogenase class IV
MYRYFMPVEFYFGENIVQFQAQKMAKFGTKCFLVTGRYSARKCGALDDVISTLDRLKIGYELFEEIPENPDLNIIISGAEKMRNSQCDFLIGIGGGSPLDAAKAISLLAKNNENPAQLYHPNLFTEAFPVVAIPTTSGTGTEVTPYSVITNSETGIKAGIGSPLLFPKLAFLSPNYTKTLPFHVTRDTAIDALSHLLEGIYSKTRNPLNLPIIYKGIELIYQYLNPCLQNPEDFFFREQLMTASLFGGITIAQSGTTLQHSIGYPLTTQMGLSHGYANGIVMKHIMELYSPAIQSELDSLFSYLKCDKTKFYDWLSRFDFKLPMKMSEEFLANHVQEVLSSKNMALNPINVTGEQIRKIYLSL